MIISAEKIYLDDPNLGKKEKKSICQCIDSGFVSTYGPYVSKFEEFFARSIGCSSAVGLQSGTAGLHMALYELGIGDGDEVIVPSFTFVINPFSNKYDRIY